MFNREKSELKRVPMMPVRDLVIFPQMMNPFIVGRESSLRALEEALAGDKKIFLATQHDASVDDPKPDEIYTVGTLANIVQSVRLPDGNLRVLVEGVERAKVVQVTTEEGFFRATLKVIANKVEPSPQVEQAVTKVTGLFEQYVKLSQSLNYDTMIAATRVDDAAKLSDTIASNLQIPVEEKQELLENFDPLERLNRVGEILESGAKDGRFLSKNGSKWDFARELEVSPVPEDGFWSASCWDIRPLHLSGRGSILL